MLVQLMYQTTSDSCSQRGSTGQDSRSLPPGMAGHEMVSAGSRISPPIPPAGLPIPNSGAADTSWARRKAPANRRVRYEELQKPDMMNGDSAVDGAGNDW